MKWTSFENFNPLLSLLGPSLYVHMITLKEKAIKWKSRGLTLKCGLRQHCSLDRDSQKKKRKEKVNRTQKSQSGCLEEKNSLRAVFALSIQWEGGSGVGEKDWILLDRTSTHTFSSLPHSSPLPIWSCWHLHCLPAPKGIWICCSWPRTFLCPFFF